ncbi:MAG: RDD family protein [Bacteroidota bacterium]
MEYVHIRRIPAFLIDVIIAGILSSFVGNFLPVTFEISHFEMLGMKFTWGITLNIVFFLLYLVFFDLLNYGNTLGKLLLRIVIVSKNEEVVTSKRRLIRSLYKTLSVIILPVSALLFVFKKYYTIQDHYTNTATIARK